ncbi:MAG: hypothetical protein M3O82_06745 [Verrucomicrobiota bacterium]|nr:hypothetical protein [Verrucomicrobiota bacterium]
MAGAARRRRVQCPRCREIIVLEKPADPVPQPTEKAAAILDENARQQARIDALEARVAMLENALARSARPNERPGSRTQLKWFGAEKPPDFSPEQADALRHNLRTIPAHRISILSPEGDAAARLRAEWLKEVFECAHWSVLRPEKVVLPTPGSGLSFASRLPVSPEVAATYFAMCASGFDLVTQFDPDLNEAEPRLIVA